MRKPRNPAQPAAASEAASIVKLDPPACLVRVLGQCLLSKGRSERLKQPSLKERPEKPIPRTPSPTAARKVFRQRTAARDAELVSRSLRKQPSLKERPEKPIPRTPSPKAARKRPPPTNSLRARRRTKPTICSSPRRKSLREIKAPTTTDAGKVALPAEAPAGAAANSNTAPARHSNKGCARDQHRKRRGSGELG